jgi:hypothetical protein
MELFRALASLLEPPSAAHRAVAGAAGLPTPPTPDEHTDVLVFQAYPYASVYLSADGMMGGEARDLVAGFWRALGAEPPMEPDHASALLAALARLIEAEEEASLEPDRAARVRAARAALFWDHIASWMPPYLGLLHRVGSEFFRRWAALAEQALAEEAERLGPPDRLALPLRLAPPAVEASPAGLDELLVLLLAPARTGLTVARDDLLRAADELRLGCRAGERRFALRSLLEQDAGAVLDWLAGEARRQSLLLAASPLQPAAGWWSARAQASAGWLDELARSAMTRGEGPR